MKLILRHPQTRHYVLRSYPLWQWLFGLRLRPGIRGGVRHALPICLWLVLTTSCFGESLTASIAPQDLVMQLGTAEAPLILDVRSEAEYASGHVPGAVNIPHRMIASRLAEIADFKTLLVVVYCEVGVRAGVAESRLEQAGFQQIRLLDGHMERWRRADLPIAIDAPPPMP